MQALRESVVAAEEALGSRAAAWHAVLATVAAAHGLGARPARPAPLELPQLGVWAEPDAVEHLGAVHESLVAGRSATGTFYTPPALVDWVLDRALPPEGVPHVLDPACGAGHFLVAVVRRLVARGVAASDAVAHVHGVDLDPVAVAITRLRLQVLAGSGVVEPDVCVADGLSAHAGAPYDVVVGNPPFLGQLRSRTASGRVPGFGPYTDTSAVFLAHALTLVGPGGRVALVQPISLLAARDAAPARAAVQAAGAVTAFWSSPTPVFGAAAVLTCAPVVVVGAAQHDVATWHGARFEPGPPVALPAQEWGALAAPSLHIPTVAPTTAGTLADLGSCTADFRDQYYGVVPFVHEGDRGRRGAPLVTSGLIDPARNRWGERETRFAKTRYAAPTVDLDALHAAGTLSAWATARLVPKVLVATQGRVIEAVVDTEGAWLPSVPVLSLVVAPERLWHALAVLLSPPVVALVAARYLGTALSPGAIKLSARQVAALPLPADLDAWSVGADLARAAQLATDAERPSALRECAEAMCAAYDDDRALSWWLERARLRPLAKVASQRPLFPRPWEQEQTGGE